MGQALIRKKEFYPRLEPKPRFFVVHHRRRRKCFFFFFLVGNRYIEDVKCIYYVDLHRKKRRGPKIRELGMNLMACERCTVL